jgi:hypothetical protein
MEYMGNLGKIGILAKSLRKIGILVKILGKIGILAKNFGKIWMDYLLKEKWNTWEIGENLGKNKNTCEKFGKNWNTCEKCGFWNYILIFFSIVLPLGPSLQHLYIND